MTLEETRKKLEGVGGWLLPNEVEFLYEQARKLKKRGEGVIVEIGSFKGRSTITLAAGSDAGDSLKIHAIDPHMTDLEQKLSNNSKSSLDEFKKNVAASTVGHLVDPIVGLSQNVVKTWNKPVEFLWIDGDHSYVGAKMDFDLWAPFLVDGGVIAYHDSYDIFVQQVLKESIFDSKYYSHSGFVGTIAFATKRSQPVSLFQKIRNKFMFNIIKYHRIFNNARPPKWIHKPVKKVGKLIMSALS